MHIKVDEVKTLKVLKRYNVKALFSKKNGKLVYKYHVDDVDIPYGILIDKLCKCGCEEHIIYSFNRIHRNEPPPRYKWGHFGIINLKEYRYKKGNIPWDQGGHLSPETCKKISLSKTGMRYKGMFEDGHTRNKGKKHPRWGKKGKDSPNFGKKYKKRSK